MIWEVALILFVILIAGIVQGASSFGFGLVVMGILPIILTVKESTLIVLSLIVVAAFGIVLKIYKYIEVKGLLVILTAAIIARIAAFFVLVTYGELPFMKQWLGFLLVGMVIYLLVSKRKTTSPILMKPIVPIILGTLGGFIGGVFAIGGPFFVFYFMMLYEEKHKYNANLQVTVLVTSIFSIILHAFNGDLNSTFYLYSFIGIISTYLGTMIGLKWFEKLSANVIKKIAMCLIAVSALNLILF